MERDFLIGRDLVGEKGSIYRREVEREREGKGNEEKREKVRVACARMLETFVSMGFTHARLRPANIFLLLSLSVSPSFTSFASVNGKIKVK